MAKHLFKEPKLRLSFRYGVVRVKLTGAGKLSTQRTQRAQRAQRKDKEE
jgi:hypothetical protein